MNKSHTVSSNIPKLSLLLFSRTLIFFFKNIQSLQSRLQVCSLIQSFSNSRFTYLFLALYIEFLKFLIFFWKIRFESIFVCVCMANVTDSEEFMLLSRVRMGHKREFAFVVKAQSEICRSLGRTLATLRYRESEGEKKNLTPHWRFLRPAITILFWVFQVRSSLSKCFLLFWFETFLWFRDNFPLFPWIYGILKICVMS